MKGCMRKIMISTIVLVVISSYLSACSSQPVKVSATNTAMGTVVQATLYVPEEEAGSQGIQAVQEELERLEKECLSWRVEDSQVARLNAHAGTSDGVKVSEELYQYLEQVWKISNQSHGALDVTVGKVVRVWDLDTWATLDSVKQQEFLVPEEAVLQKCLQDTGYQKVILQDGKVYLPEDMCLDLGAVGKGIACDRVGDYLKKQEKIKGAVVSVGGSVVTYGSKSDGSTWNVAITHPREEGQYLGTLSLQGEWYVSTSGDYERYVEKDGKRYHHIMNPVNGYPADSGLCSVTILSKNGLTSDALSTACFVLGTEEGLRLVKEMGVEAIFVTTELEIIMTDGMKKYFKEK